METLPLVPEVPMELMVGYGILTDFHELNGESRYIDIGIFFNTAWYLQVSIRNHHLVFELRNRNLSSTPENYRDCNMECRFKLSVVRSVELSVEDTVMVHRNKFLGKIRCWTGNDLKDMELDINIKVWIRDRTRSFDDPKFSDIAIKVEDMKFHVSKLFLASHSTYFDYLFYGENAIDKEEIEIKICDSYGFQLFLEALHVEMVYSKGTVEHLLIMNQKFGAPTVRRGCETFLLETTEIPDYTEKYWIAEKFKLDKVWKKLIRDPKNQTFLRSWILGAKKDSEQWHELRDQCKRVADEVEDKKTFEQMNWLLTESMKNN